MTSSATLFRLAPAWTASLQAMRLRQILVRSQCRRCGALMREDVDALIGLHGAGASLIDRQARCRMVGCDGAAYYLAARAMTVPGTYCCTMSTCVRAWPTALQRAARPAGP
ncbi:hypothetical protein ACFSHP_17270 [Novosphingobium panipatense]